MVKIEGKFLLDYFRCDTRTQVFSMKEKQIEHAITFEADSFPIQKIRGTVFRPTFGSTAEASRPSSSSMFCKLWLISPMIVTHDSFILPRSLTNRSSILGLYQAGCTGLTSISKACAESRVYVSLSSLRSEGRAECHLHLFIPSDLSEKATLFTV